MKRYNAIEKDPGITKYDDNVEVRDSRTGYLVPGRDGPGVWPDGRVVGAPSSASSGNSGRHSDQGTIFGVFFSYDLGFVVRDI